jgi:O-antigen ligase
MANSSNILSKPNAPETQTKPEPFRLFIPFITTSLVWDVQASFLLQPVFWVLGFEFFAPAIFSVYLLGKMIFLRGKIRVPKLAWLLVLFLIWKSLHVLTIPTDEFDIFLKSVGTYLTVFCYIIVVYNLALVPANAQKLLSSLFWLGAITSFLGLVYISGIWRGSFNTLIGVFIPAGLAENSVFFGSLVTHSLGFLAEWGGFYRVQSTFWHPSSYGTALLVFFAVTWLYYKQHKRYRLFSLLVMGMLFINIFFTISRMAMVAYLLILGVIWWLGSNTVHTRMLKVALVLLFMGILLAGGLILYVSTSNTSLTIVNDIFLEFRPSSALTRFSIYQDTLTSILTNPLWGFGTQVKTDVRTAAYSVGSHSDWLSVLFANGIPGFILYALFFVNIWSILIKGFRFSKTKESRELYKVTIALLLAIHLRQFTEDLAWDIYVIIIVFAFLILALAHYAGRLGTNSSQSGLTFEKTNGET